MTSMSKTTLYLPVELQRALRAEAKRSGTSQADLVRQALAAFLAGRQRPLPSSLGIVADGSLAARDTEDWLRNAWGAGP